MMEKVLLDMVAPETAGDPMSTQKWVRSSLRALSARLRHAGHTASAPTVRRLLTKHDYSLRVNAKEKEARAQHPDRDTQFRMVALPLTVVQGGCDKNGGPIILLLARSPAKPGGLSWTPRLYSASIGCAPPEARLGQATLASTRARTSASLYAVPQDVHSDQRHGLLSATHLGGGCHHRRDLARAWLSLASDRCCLWVRRAHGGSVAGTRGPPGPSRPGISGGAAA